MSLGTLHVRVARKAQEALDICTFELVDTEGGALPAFSAGSHVDVQLPNGLTRQYSLCNDPTESHRYLIGVLKDPSSRGGSKAMHELVNEGNRLTGSDRLSVAQRHGRKTVVEVASRRAAKVDDVAGGARFRQRVDSLLHLHRRPLRKFDDVDVAGGRLCHL